MTISCMLVPMKFVVGGIGILIFLRQAWRHPVVKASTAISSWVILLFWDGGISRLDVMGFISLLIDAEIPVAVRVLRRSDFGP